MKIKVLEQTSAPRILLYLLGQRRAMRKELRDRINASQPAIYRAIAVLLESGLAREVKEDHFPYRIWLELTDKGRKVAELLSQIEEVLQNP